MNDLDGKEFKSIPDRIVLSTDVCTIVESEGSYKLFIKMGDGQHAMQSPYPANVRGLIGALTLAIDVVAGKIILAGSCQLRSEVKTLTFTGGNNE